MKVSLLPSLVAVKKAVGEGGGEQQGIAWNRGSQSKVAVFLLLE